MNGGDNYNRPKVEFAALVKSGYVLGTPADPFVLLSRSDNRGVGPVVRPRRLQDTGQSAGKIPCVMLSLSKHGGKILRDCTPDPAPFMKDAGKIQSDLHGDMQTSAEMTDALPKRKW